MSRSHPSSLVRPARVLGAWLLASACAAGPAFAGDGPMSINNPSGTRSGDISQALRDRGGIEQGATSPSRKEIFTLQTMTFSLVDRTASSRFVRLLPDNEREADVRVVDRGRSMDKTFLYRARCDARTFYFGPPPADGHAPALKPIEGGSVGDLLFKQVCAAG